MKSVLALILLGCLVTVQSRTLRLAEPDVNGFLQDGEKLLDVVRNYASSAQSLVETANLTKILDNEVSLLVRYVSKSLEQSTQTVMKMADEYTNQGRDVSTCVDKYTEQAAALTSVLKENAKKVEASEQDQLKEFLAEVAARITDMLPDTVSYWEAAKQEAAKPNFSSDKAARILWAMNDYADTAKNNYDVLRGSVEAQPDDTHFPSQRERAFFQLEDDAESCMEQQEIVPAKLDINGFLKDGEKLLDVVQNYASSAQSLVETANLTKIDGDTLSLLERDVSKSLEQSTQTVTKMADEYRNQGKDVSTCVDKYTEQAAALASVLKENAKQLVDSDQDQLKEFLAEVAGRITDMLPDTVSYWEAAKQEAAKPNFSSDKAATILWKMNNYADTAKHNYDVLSGSVEAQPDDIHDLSREDPAFFDLEDDAESCMQQQ